ncbi:unnamed protein product [Brassica rapa]|uniref:Uncharacterized protein n=1 Tax=Brassica campestris TaxID=3711 RepID=A0A8D9M0P6_BRACM|nr:unnamed protein product [Brassica rapa]
MAMALRSNTSRETASLTLSLYFIFNRLHAATPRCNHHRDPPDLWQPPGYGVSLWDNPGHGGGGSIPGAGNGTWSDSKEDSWGNSLDGHCFEPRIMLQNTYAQQYSKDSQFSEVDIEEYQFRTTATVLDYGTQVQVPQ